MPYLPSTCIIVLTVSTGVKKILNSPATTEPPAALTITGNLRVLSKESIKARNKVLEKVSPNRDNGPYSKAGVSPSKYMFLLPL